MTRDPISRSPKMVQCCRTSAVVAGVSAKMVFLLLARDKHLEKKEAHNNLLAQLALAFQRLIVSREVVNPDHTYSAILVMYV